FFFQAEDGIRDGHVTGVQTCALPILGVPDAYQLPSVPGSAYLKTDTETLLRFKAAYVSGPMPTRGRVSGGGRRQRILPFTLEPRSEERRVGKGCRSRWWADYLRVRRG